MTLNSLKKSVLDRLERCYNCLIQVFSVRRGTSYKCYAMKFIDKHDCEAPHILHSAFKERKILQRMANPFIVELFYAFQDSDYLYMVVSLARGGDLRHQQRLLVGFDEEFMRFASVELICGLQYLHSNLIIHRYSSPNIRDLKPENILLHEDGHLLITDFNISVSVKERLPVSQSGTRPYMGPEMFTGQPYSFSIDWWALGVTLFECRIGRRPFKIDNVTDAGDIRKIHQLDVQFPSTYYKADKFLNVSPEEEDFIRGLLIPDPSQRLGATPEGLRDHPWFSDIDWDIARARRLLPPYIPQVSNEEPKFSISIKAQRKEHSGVEKVKLWIRKRIKSILHPMTPIEKSQHRTSKASRLMMDEHFDQYSCESTAAEDDLAKKSRSTIGEFSFGSVPRTSGLVRSAQVV